MDSRLRLIGLLLCAALGALWLASLRSDEGPASGSAQRSDAEAPAPEAEPADPEPSESPARIYILEFGSGDGSANPPFDAGDGEMSEAGAPGPGAPTPLPAGSGQIRFTVEDGAGRPADGAAVTLRSLEPSVGAERMVTGRSGEAHFVDLAAGRYAYRIQAPIGPEVASADSIHLENGEWKDLTVRLIGVGLSIVGRVLNPQGEPIAGIEISAKRHHFASAVSESVAGDRSPRITQSQGDGSFEIRSLAEGEYDVEARATDRFAPAKLLLQAGGAPVDIVLREGLRVYGTVTNEHAEPLAQVHVGAHGPTNVGAYTNERGSYELQLERELEAGESSYTIRFNLKGYEELERKLPQLRLEPTSEVRLDAELRAVENAALVTGVVESERGEPVTGANVTLSRQTGPKYHAQSDADGRFSLADVEVGSDYRISVVAPVPYRDYSERDIQVAEGGTALEIVLETLATGRLTGRMVDVEGSPLPGFRLWLVGASVRSAVPVASDDQGYFALENAPSGSLNFDTRTFPRLIVTGLTLREGGDTDVLLVLDAGEHRIEGTVLDDRGGPVSGAQVSLAWSQTSGGLQSKSQRATATDPNGSFQFSQLGPGEHLVEVRAAGYRTAQEYHDADRYAAELEIRLEPIEP